MKNNFHPLNWESQYSNCFWFYLNVLFFHFISEEESEEEDEDGDDDGRTDEDDEDCEEDEGMLRPSTLFI